MPDASSDPIDDSRIFLAELGEIRRRRTLIGLDTSRLEETTRPLDRGLTGLAFSGGGIRAACFSLGITQALARHNRLTCFDYLSTVSGGGYFGSALSSLLGIPSDSAEPDPAMLGGAGFPFRLGIGAAEPDALSHLRSFSSFLTPDRGIGKLRLAAVLLRGIVLNIFLFLPWVMFAVVCTELWFEVESRFGFEHVAGSVSSVILTISFVLMILSPFAVRLAPMRWTWARRNWYELLLAHALAASMAAIALLPLDFLTTALVKSSWPIVRDDIMARLAIADSPVMWASGVILVTMWAVLYTHVRWLAVLTRMIRQAVLYALGPLLIGGTYLLLCAGFVHLPYVTMQVDAHRAAQFRASMASGVVPDTLQAEIGKRLAEEESSLRDATVVTLQGSTGYWVRGNLASPGRRVAWFFGPTDGPRGGEGIAMYRVALKQTGDTGTLHVGVTLRQYPEPQDVLVLLLLLLIAVINGRLIDVNVTSLHGFYRDRLSKAFLLRRAGEGLEPNDEQRLSDLNPSGLAPYHLLNAAVNVSGSTNPLVRGRSADFFLFSKCFCGSLCTSYCETAQLEAADSRLDLASAAAISGAAAGPRMGVLTDDAIAGDMTLFNLRLGYWLPNPRRVVRSTRRYQFRGPGPGYLLSEAFGTLHERGVYVNVSDGGHIENLGVYELLRRRCRLIVAVDTGSDPDLTCDALATLARYARIDLGVVIDMDLAGIRDVQHGISASHWGVGTIHYSDRGSDDGTLVYLKASLTGNENEYVNAFRREYPDFPQESVADQFFDEQHFEAYRALGDQVATMALADKTRVGELLRGMTAA